MQTSSSNASPAERLQARVPRYVSDVADVSRSDLPQHTVKMLRNTYALLAMTLLFSAAIAAVSLHLRVPPPGLIFTLVAYFGLFYWVSKARNSAWALPAVFALTGFMGYSLGPILTHTLALPGGAQAVLLALATTGTSFLAISAYVLQTRRDLSYLGGFIAVGMVIALLASLAALFWHIPALALMVSAVVALLSVASLMFETSRLIQAGETNYVMATVGLYVSIFNLFTSLLSLFGFAGSDD
jgi:modulator of FtsH protease